VVSALRARVMQEDSAESGPAWPGRWARHWGESSDEMVIGRLISPTVCCIRTMEYSGRAYDRR
jgi:hypothetical protein